MKSKLLFVMACVFMSFTAIAQYTVIPDTNFEQALIELGHDSDGIVNQQVLTSDISSLLILDVSNKNISSLTGIEDFIALTTLQCHNNQLSSINISNNLDLEEFSCWGNQLTSLDVSGNTKLKSLFCGFNLLTGLDVSSNLDLEILHSPQNELTSLNVSTNSALTDLRCDLNQLTSLDLSNNLNLLALRCEYNQLTSLDLSNNIDLVELSCDNNQLANLDVLNNTELEGISCWNNQLTSLDVSKNTKLKTLFCGFNQLASLDITYNTDLEILHSPQNLLTSLDVSTNSALTELRCDLNQLTNLDITNNLALIGLRCEYNQLTNLDVSNNSALMVLRCDNNQLATLDVSSNLELEEFICWNNLLTSLDVTENTNLKTLFCGYNQLTSLDVSLNSALENLHCLQNELTSLDISNNESLTELHCDNNQLTSLNLKNGNNYNITSIRIQDNSDLLCAEVDDAEYSNSNWFDKDEQTAFTENCDDTLSDYVILAQETARLRNNNQVLSGNVGVTNSDGKAKIRLFSNVVETVEASEIIVDISSSIGEGVLEPSEVNTPDFIYNLISDDSSFNIVVQENETVTLSESEYGKIDVRNGGTVIFSNSNVYLRKLKVRKNATVDFDQCTNLFIQESMRVDRYTSFNPSENSVMVYADGNVVVKRGTNVKANINANNSVIKAEANIFNPSSMKGMFVARKVKGKKFVNWEIDEDFIACEPSNTSLARNSDDKNQKEQEELITVTEKVSVIPELISVKAWPIPSDGSFNLKVNGSNNFEVTSIKVYDINGRLVHKNEFSSKDQYVFGDDLNSGIYVVKISQASFSKTIRVIKR